MTIFLDPRTTKMNTNMSFFDAPNRSLDAQIHHFLSLSFRFHFVLAQPPRVRPREIVWMDCNDDVWCVVLWLFVGVGI